MKLKINEAAKASEASTVPSLNDFILNILSDQVKISANLDF